MSRREEIIAKKLNSVGFEVNADFRDALLIFVMHFWTISMRKRMITMTATITVTRMMMNQTFLNMLLNVTFSASVAVMIMVPWQNWTIRRKVQLKNLPRLSVVH